MVKFNPSKSKFMITMNRIHSVSSRIIPQRIAPLTNYHWKNVPTMLRPGLTFIELPKSSLQYFVVGQVISHM